MFFICKLMFLTSMSRTCSKLEKLLKVWLGFLCIFYLFFIPLYFSVWCFVSAFFHWFSLCCLFGILRNIEYNIYKIQWCGFLTWSNCQNLTGLKSRILVSSFGTGFVWVGDLSSIPAEASMTHWSAWWLSVCLLLCVHYAERSHFISMFKGRPKRQSIVSNI